jgi:TorA maturation chaperone TorD
LRTLAALLSQPEDDALDALRDLLPQAPWLAEVVAELEGIPLERWQAEHTSLLLNGWPRTPCPPFESAYRHGQMGGSSATDLGNLYRRAGLRATEAPPDYLGTLLECAAWLAEQPDGAPLLRELEQEHLDRWVPRFARDLQANARLVLYRALGERLAALFPEDVAGD